MSDIERGAFVLGFEPEFVVVPIAALMPVKSLR